MIVIPPEPLVKVPAFTKSPLVVMRLAPGVRIAPLLIFRVTPTPKIFAAPMVIAPVPLIVTSAVPRKVAGHSPTRAVRAEAPALY